MLMNRTTPFMVPVDEGNPAIIKDEALCSQCGHCFAICEEEIGVAAKYLLILAKPINVSAVDSAAQTVRKKRLLASRIIRL